MVHYKQVYVSREVLEMINSNIILLESKQLQKFWNKILWIAKLNSFCEEHFQVA